jgi:hypothetical protein
MYEIVTFYAEDPKQNFTIENNISGACMLNILLSSAKRITPSVYMTILTTESTDLSAVSSFNRVNFDINFSHLMLERTRAQCSYLESNLGSHPIAMLDSDIIVNRDLTPLFLEDFDIGLTWRQQSQMPFNGGAIFINNIRPEHSRHFFRKLTAIYEQFNSNDFEWYGDQYALANLINLESNEFLTTDNVYIDDVTVRMLNAELYNYTPKSRITNLTLCNADEKILHFKEKSRRFMQPFWQHHVALGRKGRLIWNLYLTAKLSRLLFNDHAYRQAWRNEGRRSKRHRRQSISE